MDSDYSDILNPVGVVHTQANLGTAGGHARKAGRVVALLNNSKPNVDHFLKAVEDELRRSGRYDIVKVTKPRSAAPSPELHALVTQCDFVINAVAD